MQQLQEVWLYLMKLVVALARKYNHFCIIFKMFLKSLNNSNLNVKRFDGMAIAWAVLEYLVDTIGCRVLFATHYKELATLSQDRAELGLLRLDAIESDMDGLVYLHRVEQGVARGSYGVHVAKIAGVPAAVVRRAAEVLPCLEQKLDVDSAKTKSD